MLHKKYVNRGFTLVELLSVIVILAIILVIAVPKIMSVITDSKKSSLETSAKMIASTAEKTKVQKELLGEEITGEVDCSEFTKVTSDYASCKVKFDGNTAKVNITGAGKFDGLYICGADKNNVTAQTEICTTDGKYFSYDIVLGFDENVFVYSAEVEDVDKCKSFFIDYRGREDSDATNICNNNEDIYGWNLQQNATNVLFYNVNSYNDISSIEEVGIKGKYKKITSVEILNKDNCTTYLNNKYPEEGEDNNALCSGNKDSYGTTIEELILSGSIPVTDFVIAGLTVSMVDYAPTHVVIITDYNTEGGLDVVIPSTIDGYSTNGIAFHAFSDDGLTSVVIPNTVTRIYNFAFYGNPLTKVYLENPNIKIRNCAFGFKEDIATHNLPDTYECHDK